MRVMHENSFLPPNCYPSLKTDFFLCHAHSNILIPVAKSLLPGTKEWTGMQCNDLECHILTSVFHVVIFTWDLVLLKIRKISVTMGNRVVTWSWWIGMLCLYNAIQTKS